jgi:hypothetical protein
MDLEKKEQLEKLHDGIEEFLTFIEEHEDIEEEDGEYEFLADESGVSNTEWDNFIESLNVVSEHIEKLK